jgi:hypothetical protein
MPVTEEEQIAILQDDGVGDALRHRRMPVLDEALLTLGPLCVGLPGRRGRLIHGSGRSNSTGVIQTRR